jgi:hypothetical protein
MMESKEELKQSPAQSLRGREGPRPGDRLREKAALEALRKPNSTRKLEYQKALLQQAERDHAQRHIAKLSGSVANPPMGLSTRPRATAGTAGTAGTVGTGQASGRGKASKLSNPSDRQAIQRTWESYERHFSEIAEKRRVRT